MKPIQLKLAGLQSYRTEQTINFDELCASGVFGIFGPTGSGKSTILDAITLALYGRVERATNGTQGIMNQAEDQLSVSFSFQLSHGKSEEHYVVERQYKRKGDTSMQQSLSRVLELTDAGTTVLADKATEVDRLVQELLGLTMADFTRAVVLPQGKFSEFLGLRGTDRRAMLQRLFHLEEYGIGLNQKLAAQIKQNELTLTELEAEQSGLGDASELAVKQANQRLEEAKQQHFAARKQWQQIDKQYEQAKQRLEWQKELASVMKRQEELDAQQPAMQSMELKLQYAAEANSLKPYIDQLEQAASQATQLREHYEKQEQSFQASKLSLETARKGHETAHHELTQKEPELIIRVEQFREAVGWATELLQEQKQLDAIKQETASLREAVKEKQAELVKERELRTKALNKQTALQQQAAALEYSSEDRSKLRKMNIERQTLLHAQQQNEQHERDVAIKQQVADQAAKHVATISNSAKDLLEQGSLLLSQLIARHESILTTEQHERHVKELIAKGKDRLQAAEREHYHKQLAVQLAAELTHGKPCPVCGSVEHPLPMEADKMKSHDLAGIHPEANEQLELKQNQLAEYELTLRQMKWQTAADGRQLLEQLDHLLKLPLSTEFTVDVASIREASAALEAAIAEGAPQANVAQLRALPDLAEGAMAAIDDFWAEFTQSMEATEQMKQQTEREFAGWIESCQSLLEQFRSYTAELKAAENNVNEAKIKAAESAKQTEQLVQQWKTHYPDVLLEQAEERMKQFEADERKLDELKQRIDKSIPFMETLETKIQKLDDDLRESEKKLIQAESETKHRERSCKELEEKLRNRVGEHGPQNRLTETEQQLQQLREAEQQTRLKKEQAEKHFEQISEQFSATKEAVRSAEERLERTENDLQVRLNTSRFNELAEVKRAYLTEEAQEEMREQLEQYKEQRMKTKQNQERLEQQIGNQFVTDEQWQETERKWQQARQHDESALQEMAKAERDREDVNARHKRWQVLEADRLKEAEKREQLGKLQRVFRGNAFVEFIAEEQLIQVSRDASARLGELTRQRYAIEVDSAGGFLIRDNANGGVKRPVSTLSGGETFLTSLALALALSAQIQLRGKYPLEFFFLDEGFGTLDGDLLETVISALERLHLDKLSVGVISHVPELRARLPRKLIIHPASPGGKGSRVEVETI